MKLSTDILPDYFTIASPHNSHYAVPTNTFDFVDRGSKVLLVTCGDSWTWGAGLENKGNEFRLTHVYGNIVSDRLGADWLNLGQSGSNNFFIAERIEELSKIVPELTYDKIYLICTFTEIGRSFNSQHDMYIDYSGWFNNPESTFDKFSEFLNRECYTRIKAVADKHSIELKIGSNFIDPIIFDSAVFLPTPWFRLLDIPCPVISYSGTTGVSRLRAVEEFIPDSKQMLFKSWMVDLIDKSYYTDQVSYSSKLFQQHPYAEGHAVWAKYILENINQKW
jgi:hypothetical protein